MLKRICREQYEKDFDEMFKLDKKGLMTDIDCYVENLENKNERLDLLYKTEVQKNEILRYEIKTLQQRIDKATEYIENHSLYETEYDYDYEENSYLSGIDDEIAKKELLEILKGDNND